MAQLGGFCCFPADPEADPWAGGGGGFWKIFLGKGPTSPMFIGRISGRQVRIPYRASSPACSSLGPQPCFSDSHPTYSTPLDLERGSPTNQKKTEQIFKKGSPTNQKKTEQKTIKPRWSSGPRGVSDTPWAKRALAPSGAASLGRSRGRRSPCPSRADSSSLTGRKKRKKNNKIGVCYKDGTNMR